MGWGTNLVTSPASFLRALRAARSSAMAACLAISA